jgi:uncharacterized protein YmfQ (DUF2313 family)
MADFELEALILEIESVVLEPLEDGRGPRLAAFEALTRELYPHGRAWTSAPGSVTLGVLGAIAEALIDVELQVDRFAAETNPETTSALLAEWEQALGLPDPCIGAGANIEARRASIVRTLVGMQEVSTSGVLGFLAMLGYAVTLERFEPLKAGSGGAGDPVYGIQWQFVLGVHYWGSGDRTVLECSLPHVLPAHVAVVFYYGEFTPADLSFDIVLPPLLTIA